MKFKSQLTIMFFTAVNHLSGPLRKQNFTSTGSKDHVWDLPLVGFDLFWVLPNFIPRGDMALPDFPRLFKKSSFKMADSRSKNSNESILFRRNIDQYSLGESV